MPVSEQENKREFAPFIAGISKKHTSTVLEPHVNLDVQTSPPECFHSSHHLT